MTRVAAPLVSIERDGDRVATVTFHRPGRANAFSRRLMIELIEALGTCANDPALRAVVVTGGGGRSFAGGADIDEMAAATSPEDARSFITLVHDTCDAVRRLPMPTIARIDGHVLGAGLEFAASCDLRIASSASRFAMPEVRLGIPSVVESVLIPRLIGWGRTRLLLLTGRAIDADTACAWGLVEEVAAPHALDAAVARCVDELSACGPLAVRRQKRLIDAWMDRAADAAIADSIEDFVAASGEDECRARMRGHLASRGR